MAKIEILEGDIQKQTSPYANNIMVTKTADGGRLSYWMKEATVTVNKLSEEGGEVTFDVKLRDGKSARLKAKPKIYDEICGFAGDGNGLNFVAENRSAEYVRKEKLQITVVLTLFFIIAGIVTLVIVVDVPEEPDYSQEDYAAFQAELSKLPIKVSPDHHWITYTEKSKIDDSKTVLIKAPADSRFQNDFGQTITPELLIRCMENKTDVMVNFETFLGKESISVTHRFGKDEAKTTTWGITTNDLALISLNPISFARQMIEANRMTMRLTPYGANSITVEFDLYGLPETIKPIQEACGWQ